MYRFDLELREQRLWYSEYHLWDIMEGRPRRWQLMCDNMSNGGNELRVWTGPDDRTRSVLVGKLRRKGLLRREPYRVALQELWVVVLEEHGGALVPMDWRPPLRWLDKAVYRAGKEVIRREAALGEVEVKDTRFEQQWPEPGFFYARWCHRAGWIGTGAYKGVGAAPSIQPQPIINFSFFRFFS
jgi:hypothetical protein